MVAKFRIRSPRFLLVGLMVGLLYACAAIPVQEMSDARQAIQAAKEVGASTYAADDLDNAESLMEKAEEELDLGFFDRAQKHAAAAKKAAMKARDKSLTNSTTAE